MKTNTYFTKNGCAQLAKLVTGLVLTGALMAWSFAGAAAGKPGRLKIARPGDTVVEQKVDYIEQIYFAGKDKKDMIAMIAATINTLQSMPAVTASVAKQYTFLFNITDQVAAVHGACAVEEILAAGIYDIDPDEAVQQGIPKPPVDIDSKISGALSKVNDLNNSASNVAATGVIYSLQNGSAKGFTSSAKAFQATQQFQSSINKAQGVYNTYRQVKETADKVMDYFDKPCKKVTAKVIQIGPHIVPSESEAVDKQ
jgi:hypothetical protein